MLIIKQITVGTLISFTHSPWHYLKGVGRNLILNTVRKKQKEILVLDSFNKGNAIFTDEDDHHHNSLLALIRQSVDEMEMPCKRIIELFYYRGYVIEATKREVNYKNDALISVGFSAFVF